MISAPYHALVRLQDQRRNPHSSAWLTANGHDVITVVTNKGIPMTSDLLGINEDTLRKWWETTRRPAP